MRFIGMQHMARYRVCFKMHGRKSVILLAGGYKSTQDRDIKTALCLARNLWEQAMSKTKTTPYDVAEDLRTPEEMAA
jgi:hypothetical protein